MDMPANPNSPSPLDDPAPTVGAPDMTRPGRPRSFEEADALEAAMKLFWEKGFEHTSKRDLMEATGLGSQSLYNTFGDKRSLFLRAAQHYVDSRGRVFRDLLEAPGSPLENLRNVVRLWASTDPDSEFRHGCLLCNAVAEVDTRDPEWGAFLASHFDRTEESFRDTLQRAADAGEIAPDVDVADIAGMLVTLANGVAVMLRLDGEHARIQQTKASCLRLLDSLRPAAPPADGP